MTKLVFSFESQKCFNTCRHYHHALLCPGRLTVCVCHSPNSPCHVLHDSCNLCHLHHVSSKACCRLRCWHRVQDWRGGPAACDMDACTQRSRQDRTPPVGLSCCQSHSPTSRSLCNGVTPVLAAAVIGTTAQAPKRNRPGASSAARHHNLSLPFQACTAICIFKMQIART